MTKKTILFMAQVPPPVHGAALRNKSLLDSELINNEFEIIPLPLRFINEMKDMGKLSLKKICLMIRHCFRMAGIFMTRKVHLVYFTMSPSGFAFYRDMLFIVLIKIFRKKRLLHFRMKGLQNTAKGRMGKILVKYAFRGSDVVCLSRHHAQDVTGLTDKPPYIVPNGIMVEKDYLHLADQYTPQPDGIPRILFLSNLSEKKGIPELVTAMGILKKKGYVFQTSIVGNEWYMSFAEAQKLIDDEGVQKEVKLEGPKTGVDKFSFIANCDLFVFPTWFELFPGVILEAMQFGKPIVSTFEGSIPDIIDNQVNGILVEPRDAIALADAIAYMLDNGIRRQEMGENARKKFFEEFTLQVFEKRMHRVFEDVINKQDA